MCGACAPLYPFVPRCSCDVCGLRDRFPVRGCKTARYDFVGIHHLPVPTWAGVILHDAIFEAFHHDGSQFFAGESTAGLSVTDPHLDARFAGDERLRPFCEFLSVQN
jgi:hypothetical protein